MHSPRQQCVVTCYTETKKLVNKSKTENAIHINKHVKTKSEQASLIPEVVLQVIKNGT
jgi:hypothetical protein